MVLTVVAAHETILPIAVGGWVDGYYSPFVIVVVCLQFKSKRNHAIRYASSLIIIN